MILSLGNNFASYSCQAWADLGATYPIVDDRSAALWSIFGNGAVPRNVILNADGVVLYNSLGFDEIAITALLDGVLPVDSYTQLPEKTQLIENYPNPFNAGTRIEIQIHQTDNLLLEIYSIDGQKVRTLANERLSPGEYTYSWQGLDDNGVSLSSGVYIIQLVTGHHRESKRALLLK